MLALEDPRWADLESGYRLRWDARPYLEALAGSGRGEALEQLWENLFHQGDVGTASYASVPHLLAAGSDFLAASIEIARGASGNPALPEWLEAGYSSAIESAVMSRNWPEAEEDLVGRFALVAAYNGSRSLAAALLSLDGDEIERLIAEYGAV